MPVKLLLALTKLDEIGGNLENTAPLPLFFCQPLNAERPILLCYSFSRGIFLEINNDLYINTITYNHHHSIFKTFSFVSDLLLLITWDQQNKNLSWFAWRKIWPTILKIIPPVLCTLQLITSQKICLSIINNEPRSWGLKRNPRAGGRERK